jgi:hypothetical protein
LPCSSCFGFYPAPVQQRPRLFRPRCVKTVGVRRSLKAAPSRFHSLETRCGECPAWNVRLGESLGSLERQLIDGRHLGCSGSRTSSRRVGRGGPWPRTRLAAQAVGRAGSGRWARAAKAAGVGSVRAAGLAKAGRAEATQAQVLAFARGGRPVRRDHRRCVVELRRHGARPRALLPVPPWFRDKRCPSGSGRGKAPSFAFERTT